MPLTSPVLIGRDDLVALADRRLAASTGELLFLAGEAGIGKTRLLGEIIRRARAMGYAVFAAGASPGDTEIAGGLLADLGAEMRRDPAARAAGKRLQQRLHELSDGDQHRQRRLLVADLADLIAGAQAAPEPAAVPAAEPPAALPAAGVLVACEDLHWADDLTLDVIGRLGARAQQMRLIVVGTYRSDELYPRVPMRQWRTRLLTQRLAEEVRLARLGPSQTAAMAAAITGTDLPRAVTASVHARSDGIPLHVEEFLAAGFPGAGSSVAGSPTTETLVAGSSVARLTAAGLTAVGDGVPETLADAVLARAAQLSPASRALAEVASVLGRSFDLGLLTAITGEGPDAVDAGLRELTSRFFVHPRADRDGYDFRHALIRDALYADIAPLRRRDLHARAAAAATGFPDAFLSDQYERAGLADHAFRHALAAATEASAMSAHREAVQLYQRAQRTWPAGRPAAERADLLAALAAELAAVDDNAAAAACYEQAYRLRIERGDSPRAAALLPDWVAVRHLLGADLNERTTALRAALPLVADHPAERARIHAALSAAYMLDRMLTEAITDGELARSLTDAEPPDPPAPPDSADPPTPPAPPAPAAPPDPHAPPDPAAPPDPHAPPAAGRHQLRCDLDATLGSVFLFAGRMTEGADLLRGAITRSAGLRLEAQAARAYRMLGSSMSVLVEYPQAAAVLEEGIGYAARAERVNDEHYMTAHLAHVRWATGAVDDAGRLAQRVLADGGGITTEITARHVLGYVALSRGLHDEAGAHLGEAARLGAAMRELQRLSPAWWGQAEVALAQGEPAKAIALCEEGFEASSRVRDAAYLFPYVVTGTRAYLAATGPTAARDWVRRTSELLRERGIPGTLGAIDHAEGLILLHEGQTGKARAALETAAAFWAARGRFWEGTAVLLDQARCATRSRRPADAALFREAAVTAYHQAGLNGLVPLPASPAPVLSAREMEVARLVAEGRTNREIAAALTIAPKTAAAHVEHIRTKLGVSRRAQIATWVTGRAVTSRST
ncbi:helix-turn-helix transcriptional regulator [Paractinoplanes atraurantiacus]|uniref:AAA ATPase domain-containing protein n=1 Tax=Paractinoplanes atraurantiacus TaxID=1036182 RepID=A0A285JZ32_9ACTN|nr:LuxR family transcriptional regulator [Actinoplanes atraurantiacus]SNY65594.1 AAA ATPase domain-containing protein [Actinoplanes atraurantiacus]